MVIFVFLIALIFRISIAPLAFNGDIISIAEWATWLNEHPWGGFYVENHWTHEWPAHPPLISILYGFSHDLRNLISDNLSKFGVFIAVNHLGATYFIWLFDFITWLTSVNHKESNLQYGIMFAVKLFPIFADLTFGALIYLISRRAKPSKALFFTTVYLFSPFSWYLSAIWGQSDQMATLALFISFILMVKKYPILSLGAFSVAFNLKPTVAIFIPLYFYLVYVNRVSFVKIISGFSLAIGMFLWWLSILNNQDSLYSAFRRFIGKIFFTRFSATSVSAFNFWFLVKGDTQLPDFSSFFLVPAKLWGFVIFAIINIYAFKIIKQNNIKATFYALFLVGFGGWIFLTSMYERYLFSAIAAGLIICIYNVKYFSYWVILSLIFLLNMHAFWYPDQFGPFEHSILQQILQANSHLAGKFLSIANLVLFFLFTRKLSKEYNLGEFTLLLKKQLLLPFYRKLKG